MTRGPYVANVSRVVSDMGATPGKRAVDQDSSATKESHAGFCHVRIRTSRCCVRRRSSRGADLADPGRVGRCGAGRDQDRRAAAAGAAVAVGVYFVLALCLFPGLGYRTVWAKLSAAPPGRKTPSAKACRDLRRRLGAAPMRALFECWPARSPRRTPPASGSAATAPSRSTGACRSRCPTPTATGPAGKLRASLGTTGYPVIRLMTVVETGTRALLARCSGTGHRRNRLRAQAVAAVAHRHAGAGDRGFDAEAFLTDLPAPARSSWPAAQQPQAAGAARLDDGSHLSRLGELACGSSPPTSPSAAPTAPATPRPTGWPPPCATRAATPPAGSSPSTTNAGNTRSPTWRCTTPSPNTACCARPIRPARTGTVGPAHGLSGAAPSHGHRHQSRPGTDPDRASFTTALETAKDLLSTPST